MQALVLVGGEGTRLKPLTLTQPKPALPLVDRPFIRFMVDWLARHGIDEVVMACGFRAEQLRAALGDEVPGGPSIAYIEEEQPLGTAGPVRLALERGLLGERFIVLNGDVLTDLDLTALQRQHAETGAAATLALHPVDDPSSYGLVRRSPDGEVTAFLEKPDPAEIDTDEVNAGAYVLERAVVDLIPAGRSVSIEREVFPELIGDGIYGCRLEGYWLDIGTPERYLQASWDILERRVETEAVASGPGLYIASSARVARGAAIGPRAVVRAGCEVADGAVVEDSVLMDNCRVGVNAEVRTSILATEVTVEPDAVFEGAAVVGAGATIDEGSEVERGARVPPAEALA